MAIFLMFMGLVKLKKILEKIRLAKQHSPTPPPLPHENMYKNPQKNTQKSRVGVWPTHPLMSFSRIFLFVLTWHNP